MHGSMVLETVWSIIPFVVSMTIFLGGAIVYFNQYTSFRYRCTFLKIDTGNQS
jgi:hypothetical protein